MTSTFGWLDTDEAHRRKSLEIVDLFKDQGTVDEIGIGTIRDAIADVLFPFTSVLQTRIKYALFVPWIVREVAGKGLDVDRGATELRRKEVALIESLIKGYDGQTTGVGIIGSQARSRVKRLPSEAYWRALRGWRLVTWDTSIDGHLRRARALASSDAQVPSADDPGSGQMPDLSGVDRELLAAEDGLLDSTTFDLTGDQHVYLAERISQSTQGSLLAWMCQHPSSESIDPLSRAWMHPDVDHMSAEHQRWLDHGRRLSTAIHGAALIYNLLLAEKVGDDDLVDTYRLDLGGWRDELSDEEVYAGWNRNEFWQLLARSSKIPPRTRTFVSAWLDIAQGLEDLADNRSARELVARREQSIKGGRSRLVNPAALDAWQGASGLVRLDYRWNVVRRMLLDFENAGRTS